MTEDLAPRGWRNYHRSRRVSEAQRDLAAISNDEPEATDWWLAGDPQSPTT